MKLLDDNKLEKYAKTWDRQKENGRHMDPNNKITSKSHAYEWIYSPGKKENSKMRTTP